MTLLAADNLSKSYRGQPALRGVALNVAGGEVVGLLGPNGAGKTTCFYLLVGLARADAGQIRWDGQDITRLPMHARARLGLTYLPQEASVFRTLSVAENILAVLELRRGMGRQARAARLAELLAELRIEALAARKGLSLSGGERRRVEIARALATNPRLILLDEPFAGVDPLSVQDLQGIIAHLRGRGIGVVITDHNVRATLASCDRAYILNAGRVIAEGQPAAILAHPEVRTVYLGQQFRL